MLLRKNASKIKRSILGFFAAGIITCVITLSFSHVSGESALMLIIFDFLFISLVFPLEGTFVKKIMLLLVGNVIGLLWNSIFSSFAYVADFYFTDSFRTLYVILSPLLNFVWVIFFWSISLSVLASSKQRRRI